MSYVTNIELDAELLKRIDRIAQEQGYSSRQQAIEAMLTAQACKGVGAVTGDAQLRNMLSITNRNTKIYDKRDEGL